MMKLVTRRYRVECIPEDLLQRAPEDGWYVLRVPCREEERVARSIAHMPGAACVLLWTVAQHHYGRGRVRQVVTPFLPGYIIVNSGGHDHDTLYSTVRPVVEILPVLDGQQFVAELQSFCRILLAAPGDLRQQPGYAQGDPVEVIGGSLQGCRGTVVRHQGNWELVVGLTVLGTVVQARVDRRLIRPIEGAS